MEKPSLLVLAAGLGARYGGPKPLAPVGPKGETFLEYLLFDARRAGFGRVVLVVRGETEAAFRRALARVPPGRPEVVLVHQDAEPLPEGRVKPWGTGHAVLCAREWFSGPFAVANGDDHVGERGFRETVRRLAALPPGGREWLLGTFPLEATLSEHGPVARGVCETSREGVLLRIAEYHGVLRDKGALWGVAPDGRERELTGREPVNVNLWGFTPAVFDPLEERFRDFRNRRGADPDAEFFLPEAISAEVTAGRARVQVFPLLGEWAGLTHSDDFEMMKAYFERRTGKGEYPSPLWGKEA